MTLKRIFGQQRSASEKSLDFLVLICVIAIALVTLYACQE